MSEGVANLSLVEHHFKHRFDSRLNTAGFATHSQ